MKQKKLYTIFGLFLAVIMFHDLGLHSRQVAAANNNKGIELKLSCTVCAVGEPIRVELHVARDHKKVQSLAVPQEGKIQYLGKSTSVQLHNFKLTKRKVYRYQVVFRKKGRYRIGPAKVLLQGGGTVSSNRVLVKIIKVDKPSKEQNVSKPKLIVRLGRQKVMATEPFLLRYYLKLKPGMRLLHRVQLRHLPRMQGSVIEPVPDWEKNLSVHSQWGVPLKAFIVYPIQAGRHKLKHATFLAQVRHDRQVFGFFQVPNKKNFSLKSSDHNVEVRSLDARYPKSDVAMAVKGGIRGQLFWLKSKQKKVLSSKERLTVKKPLLRIRFVLVGRSYWRGFELDMLNFVPKGSGEVLSVERKKEVVSLEDPLKQRVSFDIALNINKKGKLKIPSLQFLNTRSMELDRVGPYLVSFDPAFSKGGDSQKNAVAGNAHKERGMWHSDVLLFALLSVLLFLLVWFALRLSSRNKALLWDERERSLPIYEQAGENNETTSTFPDSGNSGQELQGWRNLTRKQKTLVYDLERIYRDYITRPHEEKDNYKPTVRKLRGILADIEQALASGENREKLQRAIAEMDAVSYGPAMEVQKVEEYIKRWTESTLDALQYEEK